VPLTEEFHYLWSGDVPLPALGSRVRVPFGRRRAIGIVVGHPDSTALPAQKLKSIEAVLDAEPLIDVELMASLGWAADYYHHAFGEVLHHALPVLLRKGRPLPARTRRMARLTAAGRERSLAPPDRRAARQREALALLATVEAAPEADLAERGVSRAALAKLVSKAWVEIYEAPLPDPEPDRSADGNSTPAAGFEMTADQEHAVAEIAGSRGRFRTHLLYGVTGSGKTEVFLRLIERELAERRQTLLLVPEIALTPQLVGRLRERFGAALAVLHSGLTDTDRLTAWEAARTSRARLIVGTRSAAFVPLPAAGLIVIDEEHDPSYKQQQGFRYSARDLAIVRAKRLGVPVLLASATPSLESWRNAVDGRYGLVRLPRRIGSGGNPRVKLVDLNRHASRQGLSTPMLAAIEAHVGRGNQVLLFINRRGFAPVLFCPDCTKAEECDRCDARMTIHARAGVLRCHHCAREKTLRWACPACGAERVGVGAGTQRVTTELERLYPDLAIARLDRDVVTSRDSMAAVLAGVESGRTQILVGTQMLTKGHDFPAVTLVGVLNADQGLFGTDFRSNERLAQTIVQVAGRAGRRDQPGEVVIQTHYPGHPLLERLLTHDYAAFADLALAERQSAGWPPYSHIALWRAEAPERERAFAFLDRLRALGPGPSASIRVLGPVADWMERKGGRYRAQLMLESRSRRALHDLIDAGLRALPEWRETRRVRWAIDVDPLEL
jgi:primosomal protein N' (replication factor Y)